MAKLLPIEEYPLDKLKHYPVEVRIHTQRQIEEYIESIEMFGQTRPMLVDEHDVVLAGNGLFTSLKQMGRKTGEIRRFKGLDEKQKKKLVLADNAIFSLGKDNNDNIINMIKGLEGDLEIPGFDTDLLKSIVVSVPDLRTEVNNYGNINNDLAESMSQFDNSKPDIEGRVAKGREKNEEEIEEKKIVCPHCQGVIILT